MNPVILIPTYISAKEQVDTSNDSPIAWGHTTPIYQEGELPRLLESLRNVKNIGQIVILVAAEKAIENQAAGKMHDLATQFSDLSIMVIGAPEEAILNNRMKELGLPRPAEQYGMISYADIRNMGLIIANVFGFDSVVFLDDDAVIDDPHFLTKAMYGLGVEAVEGDPIVAKTGYYLNAEDSFMSNEKDKWYDRVGNHTSTFDRWITRAMGGPRLSKSNHVLGSCLALHEDAYMKLPFDPWVARGEAFDYLLDLRMHGHEILFDNQWRIRNLQPRMRSEGLRFTQNIYRWFYEARKFQYARTIPGLIEITSESLEPHPGSFLRPNLSGSILAKATLRSITKRDKAGYRKAIKAAIGKAEKFAEENYKNYFDYQAKWAEIMEGLKNDATLRTELVNSTLSIRGIDAKPYQQAKVPTEQPDILRVPPREWDHTEYAEIIAAETAAANAALESYRKNATSVFGAWRDINPGTPEEVRVDLA